MLILGFSVGHDKGAVIIKNGEVLVGVTQERLSRIKHDGGYSEGAVPFDSIDYCLNALNIGYRDVDQWVYSTTEIIDETKNKLLSRFTDLHEDKVTFVPHHLAHAFSSFYSSGFDEGCVIVADASGSIISYKNKTHQWYPKESDELDKNLDWTEAITIVEFSKGGYKEVYKKWIEYPVNHIDNKSVSLGSMYSEGCLQLIFDPKSSTWFAGKLMGMASYADPKLVDEAPHFVKELENDIFIPGTRIYPRVTWKSDFFSKACVAGIYQREQERASLILAKLAKKLTNSKNMCTAGGSFLNCNSNELINKSGLFDNYFFIPPADDSGIPLGCAWYGAHIFKQIEKPRFINPYIGRKYDRQEVIGVLNANPELYFKEINDFDELLDTVAYWLTQNRVIGWFQDGSEIGPRALGNRSIIASPINAWMSGHINADIKGREWYRPFAPAVLFEHQSEIFESDVFSPHMLITTKVKENWREKIPAVVHIDGSARHQSVTEQTNHKFYSLIKKFYEKTDVPVLLNTSFNGPSEPMVESPMDAVNTFVTRNLDFLVVNNFLISQNPI